MAREGGGRFEFGWLGIIGMFFVFTAGSVVIFFLGIYVGKGLQESRLAREERVVRLPVSQGEGSAETAHESAEPASQAPPGATASINLAVRSAPETAPANPVPVATTAPLPAATPPRVVAAAEPTSAPVARSMPAAESLAREELPRATARPAAGGRAWSVQVNATKDEATANRLVQRLDELGYQAYIVRVRIADETWYRVRVGRFPTMEAATAIVMRLKNEERYSRAFLVNE
jgi:cell division septation protein DedD